MAFKTGFTDAYIFGSLIQRGGAQFDHQSDIDVVCAFPPECSYLERWKIVTAAIEPTAKLNLELLQFLERSDATKPIVSLVPVSSLELHAGLHKEGAAQFFSLEGFLSIKTGDLRAIGNEHKPAEAPIEGALDSIRGAQRMRNAILALSPSGSSNLLSYDGPDPLPKDFARCSAQTRWKIVNDPDHDNRFDTNEGMSYALQLLTARRKDASEVELLRSRILVRMGGRGQSSSISACDLVLLWEILAEDAFVLISFEKAQLFEASIISPELKRQAMERAGYCCSFPDCGVPLGSDGIGEVAHIYSLTIGGPRYNPSIDSVEANKLENLLVLCPTHHRMIDFSPSDYSADTLKCWNFSNKIKDIKEFSGHSHFTMLRLMNNLGTSEADPSISGEDSLCRACKKAKLIFSNYGVGPLGVHNAWYKCPSCGSRFQSKESSED